MRGREWNEEIKKKQKPEINNEHKKRNQEGQKKNKQLTNFYPRYFV